jgi:two-component system sensor histidine kinase KdpD
MRTPIAAIASATSALSEAPKAPELTASMLDEIKVATDRLNRLVGNLLNIARVESGQVKPKLDWCDVGDLINVTLKSVEKEMTEHPVKAILDPQLGLARMDFALMEQALINLLLNAAFHTPPGTPIQLSARAADGELVLTVADRGRGIPPESLPRLFEKFYRAPGAPTGGTGLGLSIVKGFAEAQNGRVQVENLAAGGAAFSIYLPLNAAPVVDSEIA